MNPNTATENTVKNLSYEEIIYQAQNAPKVLTSVSAADQDDVSRAPGLLLTKEEIISIKRYEAAALELPSTLEDVQNYLNYGDVNDVGPGLEYKNFLDLFTLTRNHALQWSPLYDEMKLTGTKLRIFAHSMSVYGDSITQLYDGILSVKKLEKLLEVNQVETLAQLKEIEVNSGEKFPDIELEKDTKKNLGSYLSTIFDKVKNNLEDTQNVHKELTDFSDTLHNRVVPKIKTQLQLVSNNSVQADIEVLKSAIDARSLLIDEKSKEYKALVEKSISNALSFNLPGLVMGIYVGVEADGVRVERNRLSEAQKLDIEKLSKKDKTLASLHHMKRYLQNLQLVTFDADVATQNLRHVWNVIYQYVKQSQSSIDTINDALSLGLFMAEFKLVIDPWRHIEKTADIFITAFKEAKEEYKKNYINDNQH